MTHQTLFSAEWFSTKFSKKWFSKNLSRCISLSLLLLAATWVLRADATSEIAKLAALMQWKQGTVVADIGAGDGSYSFAAAERVGSNGRVFATEIDKEKLNALRTQIKKQNIQNVTIVESAEADTKLPSNCCDAIFLRRVYHHLAKPVEFDANLVRSLKPGGKLAIIDFPARPGLDPVEGVPANRGGHGIPEKVVIEELTAAGLQLEKTVDDWPSESYCVVFVKK